MEAVGKIKIVAIVGPTACGKTALSIELSKRYGGEVICLDSMQIYSDMTVGTAAPTDQEKAGVPHWLFGSVSPKKVFSCADYVAAADAAIADISSRGRLPILVGGTGLYLDSLLLGCGDASAAPDVEYRESLYRFAEENGCEALHARLVELDAEAAQKIHPNNVRRVIRALEICRAYGKKSDYDRDSRSGMRYDATVVCLGFENRELLYDRINRRVGVMLENGLADEARRLSDAGILDLNSTAAQAIGYKEIMPYIRGEEPLEVSAERLRSATRRYAKRQLTWFRARDYVKWVMCDGIENAETFENIVKNIAEIFDIL